MIREEQKYKAAVKRVKKKKRFYKHLMAYITVNTALTLVVLLNEGTLEGMIPGIFWGIGLAMHYFAVFGFPGRNRVGGADWEQREIEKELGKMDAVENNAPQETESLDINEPLELKEVEKIRNRYDDSDLV